MSVDIQEISNIKQRYISPIEVITASIQLSKRPKIEITRDAFDSQLEFLEWQHVDKINWGNATFTRDVKRAFTAFSGTIHETYPNMAAWSKERTVATSKSLHIIGTICDVYNQLNTDLPTCNVYAVRFMDDSVLGLSLFLEIDPKVISVMQDLNVIKPVAA